MSEQPKHILRYGTNADKKYIDDKLFNFDLLAFNGNMLAYTPDAIASFVMLNFFDNPDKGFFIDPITHAFQHNIDKIKSFNKRAEGTVKLSIEKLINLYGEPLGKIILKDDRSIRPKDFTSDVKRKFCINVINFQLNTIKNCIEKKGYLDYISADSDIVKLKPKFITPPYFYLTESTYELWLDLNIEFIEIVREQYPNQKLFAELVISQDILSSQKMFDDIVEKYKKASPDGILVWIDNFDEHGAAKSKLHKFMELIQNFYRSKIKVYNLYGGFFSIALTSYKEELGFRLDGVGHGLEYGEYRSVVPVGGGIPISRYYFYPLHKRLKYVDATEMLEKLNILNTADKKAGAEKYYEDICDCLVCKDMINNNIDNFSFFENTEFYEVTIRGVKQRRRYPNQKTKRVCLGHYLLNKSKEFEQIRELSLKGLVKKLEKDYQKFLELSVLDLESIIYMKNWVNLFVDKGGLKDVK